MTSSVACSIANYATSVAHSFSDMLDEVFEGGTDGDEAQSETEPVVVLANPGAMNFAAALAFSALLHERKIPHRMLPQDAISPAKFPISTGTRSNMCVW